MQEVPLTKLKKLQLIKLRKLLEYSYNNVDFYHKKFQEAGIRPVDITSLKDIEKIPITTKDELRANFPERIVSRNVDKNRKILDKTSGSTKQPFEFYKDANDAMGESCSRIKWLLNVGVKLGDRRLLIRGERPKGTNVGSILSNVGFLSSFDMSHKLFNKWVMYIKKFKPKTIESYPSPLKTFADWLRDKNLKVHVPIVITVGEILTKDTRELIEDRLDCKIYDSFGAAEGMYLAQECKYQQGLHYDPTRFVVEAVCSKGNPVVNGKSGDMVITNLNNYVMPFIRYKIGDRIIMGKESCMCGSTLPKIGNIEGRIVDQMRSVSGKILDGIYFQTVFEWEAKHVKHYKIIHVKPDMIEVHLVPKGHNYHEGIERLRKNLQSYCGHDMKIVIKKVDKIPLGRTGKRVFIESRLDQNKRTQANQTTVHAAENRIVRKMNLVFTLNNSKLVGGGDYSIFKFAEYLAKKGHKVTVFASTNNTYTDEAEMTENLQIYYTGQLPRIVKGVGFLNRTWDKLHGKLKIESFFRNEKKIDFVLGYHRYSAIKAQDLGEKFDIPSVAFVFETPIWMKEQLGQRWVHAFKGRFKKLWLQARDALKKTDIIIANSKLTASENQRWLVRKIDGVVYPGMDFDKVDKISTPKKENQIIYIGRLNTYKNIDILIKALSKIKNAPKLVICGTGEEKSKLTELAARLNIKCEFKGSITDEQKWPEIKKSLFMVFPSSFEGFGMPPMEALYCGIPCICANIPIFKEIYGNKVEYFREHDVDELANKMQFLLNNPAYVKERGKAGRAYVRKKFGWDKSALKIQRILEEN